MESSLVLFSSTDVQNGNYGVYSKTKNKDKKAAVSQRKLPSLTTIGIYSEIETLERGLRKVVNQRGQLFTCTKGGDLIFMVDYNKLDGMLDEIAFTRKVQSILDFGNDCVFKNFKIYLVMEELD